MIQGRRSIDLEDDTPGVTRIDGFIRTADLVEEYRKKAVK